MQDLVVGPRAEVALEGSGSTLSGDLLSGEQPWVTTPAPAGPWRQRLSPHGPQAGPYTTINPT